MPKSTFYNLNNEKREKIEKALKKEFSKYSFEKASISNIIEEAQIPRGSFYQYFEDKEDALKYLIENFLKEEREEIEKLLLINEGDIFLTTIDLYTYLVDKKYDETELKLLKNIINKLRNENVNIFEIVKTKKLQNTKDIDNHNCYLNTQLLNIEDEKDIKYIMRILTCVLRSEVIDVMHNKISKEEGKNELLKQIEILKRGMTK